MAEFSLMFSHWCQPPPNCVRSFTLSELLTLECAGLHVLLPRPCRLSPEKVIVCFSSSTPAYLSGLQEESGVRDLEVAR